MKKKTGFAIVLIAFALLAVICVPVKRVEAKAKPKCWYGKYWVDKETGRKSLKFKGNKVTLKGKWENFPSLSTGEGTEKKINKTFRLTKKTQYNIDDRSAYFHPVKRVSKKTFLENVYNDVSYCTIKVKNGKVVEAWIMIN